MERLTPQQRVIVVKIYYQNQSSVVQTQRRLRDIFGRNYVPSKSTILRIIKNFETLFTVADRPKSGRPRSPQSNEKNIESVKSSVAENPETSIKRRAQELGINRQTIWTIMKTDLKLKELKESDHKQRRDWSTKLLQLNVDDPNFWQKIQLDSTNLSQTNCLNMALVLNLFTYGDNEIYNGHIQKLETAPDSKMIVLLKHNS
ncbi:hypothetical protein ANTRET_LOCUS10412 [Anthophora retusa]